MTNLIASSFYTMQICFNSMMMLENDLRKCKWRAIEVNDVVEISNGVKLLPNCKKYVNKFKNMLSINQDTNNVN